MKNSLMTIIDRVKIISRLAFPISVALSLTITMALVDLAMVGQLGNHAIAALGLAVFTNTLLLAVVAGIAPAVQGIVARRIGQGSTEPRCLPLNGGLLIAVVVGLPLTIVCYSFSPAYFSVISSDPQVTGIGVPYLRILSLAVIAVGMNNAFRGHWAARERTNTYMLVVLTMQCLNAFLDYTLIFGHFGAPALGATGAAIATATSLYVGVLINLTMTSVRFRKDGFLRARPAKSLMVQIGKLGIPVALQELFFAIGFIVFLWLVGQVGTAELAAANVLSRLSMLLVLPAAALGMASATLVSKAVGQGDLAAASRWGWDSAKLGVVVITLMGLPLLLFPEAFLSIFLTNAATVSMAVIPLRMLAAGTGVASLIYVFTYTLFSVGDGNRVLIVSLTTQWLFFLPAVWVVGPYLQYGLLQIWLVQAAYAAIATALLTGLWADGTWKKVRL